MENILKVLFSLVYGQGTKESQVANQIYEMVKDYLTDAKDNDSCIYVKKKDRQELSQQFPFSERDKQKLNIGTYVKFFSEYGCALLISKQKQQSSIKVQIIVPQQWSTGSQSCKASKFQFCSPKNQSSIYTPELAQYDKNLKKFVNNFDYKMTGLLKKNIGQDEVQRFTPSQVEKAVKMAINSPDYRTIYRQKIENNPEQEKKKDVVPASQNFELKDSHANTAWYVTEAIFRKVIRNKKGPQQSRAKCQKLLIGFKSSILQKTIKQKMQNKSINRTDIINFKKCLDQLIYSYKHQVSSHTKKNQKFVQIIKNLQSLIIQANGGRLNSKIQDKQFEDEKLNLEIIGVPKIKKPQKINHEPQVIQKAQIDQYNYEIDPELPFESLLDMYELGQEIKVIKGTFNKKQQFLDHWISLTEKTLFEIAYQINKKDGKKPVISLKIHMREIECQLGASNVCKIAVIYQKQVKKNQAHYGMGMRGQARSHIQLVKTICSVIAFQSVKMNRQRKKSNLQKYKIPIDVEKLYKTFISHDYLARRAVKCIYKYQKSRQMKKPLFELNGNCSTFDQFGKIVGQETRSAHVWLAYMDKIIKLEKQKIQLTVHKQQLIKRQNSLQSVKNTIVYNDNKYYDNNNWKNQTCNVFINQPLQQYSQKQKWLYAFVHNIPPDILGLIKISMIAQNPFKSQDKKILQNNQFEVLSSIQSLITQQLPLKVHNAKVSSLNSKYINSGQLNGKPIGITDPLNKIKFIFGQENCQAKVGFRENMFQHYNLKDVISLQNNQQRIISQKQMELQIFLRPPNDEKLDRQHLAYAKQNLKPQNIQIEQFLALITTRAAEQTQIVTLCSNILQRKIIGNCYDIGHKFKEQLFLQTAGQVSAYRFQTQKYFKMINKFLKQFMNVWVYSDTNFCPLLGPFVGYLVQELKDEGVQQEEIKQLKKISLQLVKKCFNEFNRGEGELKDNPSLKIQWDQRFIITSAICCFRELQLDQEDKQQLIFLTKLLFRIRTCKIFADRQEKPENKRIFEVERAYSIMRAIFKNIRVLSQFLIDNTNELNSILRQIDEGFPQQIEWQRKQIYQFIGTSKQNQDFYQIDLYRGSIYKNGKQLAALDKKIKENPQFIKIFGKDRQFQVYPSNQPFFLRTKNNLNYQFKIDQKIEQIYFQFSQDGKTIRYITRKPHAKKQKIKEYKWQLISEQNLKKSFVHIPNIFLQNHLAWICVQKGCIVFRKTKYEQLYDIGLVIHLKHYSQKQFEIQKAFHIVFHGGFENQNPDIIFDPKNQIYEEMILRSKQKQLKSFGPYYYLSKFEEPCYIFELKNQKTKNINFLLHRYQIRFRINQDRLFSESHYGYQIDSSYYQTKQCIFNKFPCLVLKKDLKNLMILNNHHRILILSDGQILPDGIISKKPKANIYINSFRYDIHDFFGDIRGSTRQSQLHLVSLFLSIDDNMRLSSMQMTPLEYAMHSLKTCFTNRPLNNKQQQKLFRIIKLANDETLLLCQVLWKGSQKLQNILPFSKQEKRYHYFPEEQSLRGRTLYNKNIQNQTMSNKKQILLNMLEFIGFSVKYAKKSPQQSSGSSSSEQFESQSYWKGIQQYKGEGILDQCYTIQYNYQKICENTKNLNFWKKQYPEQKNEGYDDKFSTKIEKYSVGDNKSLMMKQMIEQLKNSYECFIKEENRLRHVIEQFTGDSKKKNLSVVKKLIQDCTNCRQKIQKIIGEVKKQNEGHPDIISGYRPTLSEVNYTRILCYEQEIYVYYPSIMKKAAEKLKNAIKIWMDLQTRIASYRRVQVLLESEKVDIVALLREIGSPREQIFKKKQWVCFETEMKIQIWPSQLETYDNLMKGTSNGPFCQLNMGEGKTQVIIPMIVLNTIFNKNDTLPRINLLTSLYEQARGNMFRFLSVTGFQIPGFQIPFARQVELDKNNIYSIRDLINCFSGKAYILVNRQSRLSQILRFNEEMLINKNKLDIQQGICLKNKSVFKCELFDIFDEIDAMMTPKKSYIFSIGNQIPLPQANIRLEIMKQCLQIFLTKTLKQLIHEKMVTSDQTQHDAIEAVKKGWYPDGLRLTLQNVQKKKILQWKYKIADLILRDSNRHQYSFIKRLNEKQVEEVINYCINPLLNSNVLSSKISKGSKDQIYILRGILAYGIFEHCLSKRCGVDYGVPGKQHKKRIAVPYEAADIPSKTSQYQHPEVSVLLSYVAYNMRGLTEQQFKDCLSALLLLTKTSMETQYEKWIKILSEEDRKKLVIDKANKIHFNSKADRDTLFNIYRKNRMTIAFWLNKCIFPRDLKQYMQNICSSSFDLANVKKSIGFSGTMDNHWILPNKIKFTPCQTPSIRGTDGKMIYLATKYTKDICVIVENEKPLWQRFVDQSLEKKVSCIIDVGAICVGKSLKNEIVPWIAEHQNFDSQKFAGISFCDENGKWQIYDIETKFYINRGTTIPDHLTFVIFDQARTRGADLKMDENIVAAMSLGPDLTKDKFMQAAGRLRKLGRNQSIIILATHQVFSTLPTFPKKIEQIENKMKQINKKQLMELILAWCCQNTIKQNENLLLQYSNLGWKYVYSQVRKIPLMQQIFSKLEDKYEAALQTRMVSEISQIITRNKQKKQIQQPTGQHLCKILEKYGKNVPKQSGALDDVCQRQVQAQKQQQKEQQNGFNNLKAIPQTKEPKLTQQIKDTPYKFDKQFFMTTNFINTTRADKDQIDGIIKVGSDNQLPQCYFVKYNDKQLTLISLRQASLFIKQNILKDSMNNYEIALFNQLNLQTQFIKKNKLEGSYVCAKFVAGNENYTIQEQQYLIKLLLRSLAKTKNEEQRIKSHENIISLILKMRRIQHKKFSGSTLQKMITKLANEDLEDGHKQEMKANFPTQIII